MLALKTTSQRRAEERSFIADGITPIAAYRAVQAVRPGPSLLFESAPGAQMTSRYSIIGVGVRGEVRVADGRTTMSADGGAAEPIALGPLDAARLLLQQLRPDDAGTAANPFLGAYGAAAFELAGYFERLPRLARGDDPMPDLHLVVPETVVVFDHFTHHVTVATLSDSCGDLRDDSDVHAAIASASIEPLGADRSGVSAREVSPAVRAGIHYDPSTPAVHCRPDMAELVRAPGAPSFVDAVARAKESIAAGDAFQVVLSKRWTLPATAAPFDAYRALRAINPSPYMFFVDLGWGQLFGSSPEMLVRLDGRRARLRPLAGTRPRGGSVDADRKTAAALRRDPKERAEHVMLVDLGRNDLGRVCRYGSVRPTQLFGVEYYSHVMHLMSEVVGVLAPDRDAFDLLASAFPAGTVSGAPKIRAMELIAELEGARRGFYAGSVAHFGFDGSMEACITLRSAHAYAGAYHVAAGAGIVADSEPQAESAEADAKARAVLDAVALLQGAKS